MWPYDFVFSRFGLVGVLLESYTTSLMSFVPEFRETVRVFKFVTFLPVFEADDKSSDKSSDENSFSSLILTT